MSRRQWSREKRAVEHKGSLIERISLKMSYHLNREVKK